MEGPTHRYIVSSSACWALYGEVLAREFENRDRARRVWRWLEPPVAIGTLTVAHVRDAATADKHVASVWEWARDVWEASAPHHHTVRAWVDELAAEALDR